MSQNVILIISFVLGAAVAVPAYRIAIQMARGSQRFVDAAKEAGNVITGHVVKARRSWTHGRPDSLTEMDNFSDRVTYEYVIDGKYLYKVIYFPRKGVKAHSDYPEEIEIYYDPQKPKKAKCQEEISPKDQNAAGFITFIVAFIAVAYLVYLLLATFFLNAAV